MEEDEEAPPSDILEVRILLTELGKAPFESWLKRLRDQMARQHILTRLTRVQKTGNFGDHKSVGEGVWELRIDYGPGYRIYFGRLETTLVLLIAGGDKSTQNDDIVEAQQLWSLYQNVSGEENEDDEKPGRRFRR